MIIWGKKEDHYLMGKLNPRPPNCNFGFFNKFIKFYLQFWDAIFNRMSFFAKKVVKNPKVRVRPFCKVHFKNNFIT